MSILINPFTGQLDIAGGSSSPTIGGPVVGSDPNAILVTDSSSNLDDIVLSDGQLLIGTTSAAPTAAYISGTIDQVNIANGPGSITLGLPQNIATTSSPIFANLNLTPSGAVDITSSGTLAIGTGNADVINIGNSGATVNIQGTTFYQNVTDLQVTDKLITLNVGGSAGSASNSGIEIEENSIITAYLDTSADRNSWEFKAPAQTGIATISPGASGFTINQGSHDPVTIGTANGLSLSTQAISLAAASTSTTGALTSTDWNTFNGKQSALTIGDLTSSDITVTGGTGAVIGSGASLTLATVATPGTATKVTYNAKGLVTSGTTLSSGDIPNNAANTTGSAATLTTPRNINGVAFDGSADITVTAAAGTLTGTTLNSTVVSSSLTSVGTLATLTVTAPISGSITGNAATVTTNANLTGDVTSIGNATTLATVNSNVGTFNTLIVNGKGLVTAASNTSYESPLTFSTGLTRTTNTITVNTSQNISTLSNLTGNGFVKTSGGTGALSIDTNSYLLAIPGDISNTTWSGLANNTANQVVTGLTFANTISSFEVLMSVYINATASTFTTVKIVGTRKNTSDWSSNDCQFEYTGDSITGLNFTISSGQVQMDIGNITGFSAGTVKFRAITV